MRRIVLYIVLLLVPLGFFLSAWQAFAYQELERDIAKQELEQRELFEMNRRLLTELSTEQAPAKVIERASGDLGMIWPEQGQIQNLVIDPQGASNGGQ